MKFLISNDDGVHAPGLLALYEALSKVAEVVVVAPNAEHSGSGSSLHISQPLYIHKLASGFIAVNGSPADCVYLALNQLYRETRFDCVITGINSGDNLGQNVFYSGTFGAALTAQVFGVPAIAVSLVGGTMSDDAQQASRYDTAATELVKLLTETSLMQVIQQLPNHVLNVNIPNVECAEDIKGRQITRLGYRQITQPVHHIVDPRGRDAYWLSLRKSYHPQTEEHLDAEFDATMDPPISSSSAQNKNVDLHHDHRDSPSVSTDYQAIAAGYISLSPVRLHHTPRSTLDRFLDINL